MSQLSNWQITSITVGVLQIWQPNISVGHQQYFFWGVLCFQVLQVQIYCLFLDFSFLLFHFRSYTTIDQKYDRLVRRSWVLELFQGIFLWFFRLVLWFLGCSGPKKWDNDIRWKYTGICSDYQREAWFDGQLNSNHWEFWKSLLFLFKA